MSRRFVTAVVLAAGRGDRVGGGSPKQFLDLAGRPLLLHAIDALCGSDLVSAVVVVLPMQRPGFDETALSAGKVCAVTDGGPTRQASLGEGLACLPEETEIVLVHDAARPMVTERLVCRVIDGLDSSHQGVIPALPIEDALKEVSASGELLAARSREGLWRVQTPQVFDRAPLEDSLVRADAAGEACEDCSEMLTRAGYRVKVVVGDPMNLKVTHPHDLALAKAIISSRQVARRLGSSPGPDR